MSITTVPPSATPGLPAPLAELIEEFQALAPAQRLEMLVEMGAEVPDPPAPYADDLSLMERVVECQSPVYVATEVDAAAPHATVIHISAPPEAPTTRGFAGVLSEGLAGLSAAQVLAIPTDLPTRLGLDALISPLRLAGMASLQGRIQRQVQDQLTQLGVEAPGA